MWSSSLLRRPGSLAVGRPLPDPFAKFNFHSRLPFIIGARRQADGGSPFLMLQIS